MRNVINLNQDWKFIQQDAGLPESLPADWQTVQLPHSWNAIDGQDGNGSMTEENTGMPRLLKRQNSSAGRKGICGDPGGRTAGHRICKRYRSDLS